MRGIVLLAVVCFAQEFEVATVKPTPLDWRGGSYARMESAHRFVVKNYTLKSLVGAAYNSTPRGILGGPAWISGDRFDVLAATPGDHSPEPDEQMSMLRKLLADRFKLIVHREPKEFSIYALTVAKSGSRLKESTAPPDDQPYLINTVYPAADGGVDRVHLPARNATMMQFVSMLQRGVLDRPVVDRTGLSGRYDFELEWTPDETQFGGQMPKITPESHKPDLFAAIQQELGLRLEATRGPIEIVAIDQAEKPGDN